MADPTREEVQRVFRECQDVAERGAMPIEVVRWQLGQRFDADARYMSHARLEVADFRSCRG